MPEQDRNSGVTSEFETIEITNPLEEAFKVRFNGELYTIEAGAFKSYPRFLAFHIAKHLSDKMLIPEVEKRQKKQKEGDVYNPQIAQLMIYDNSYRRILLYNILKSKIMVEECIKAFPFKGFIGEMDEYEEHVAKVEAPKVEKPKAPKTEETKTDDTKKAE